jgi:hypothetical protein
VPLAIRAVVLICGIALLLLPGALHPVPVLITAVGLVAALVAPRTVGVTVLSVGFVVAWLGAAGWAHSLPVARTIPAAAALYVAHVSTALAAATPIQARVERAVIVRWLRSCVWPVLGAAALIAADEALPERTGAAWVEIAGLVAVLLFAAAAVVAVRRRAAD